MLLLLNPDIKAQSKDVQIENLVAFAKLSGNVRYFSPTDAVHNLLMYAGWDKVMVNGTRIAMSTENHRSFSDSLVAIFRPIEPSLFLQFSGEILCQAQKLEKKEFVVGVQHRGLELYGGTGMGKAFKSIRTNRRSLLQEGHMSKAIFVDKKIPEHNIGKVFELKITYDVKDRVSLSILAEGNKKISEEKLNGKSYFNLKDTLNTDLLKVELHFDEFKGSLEMDSIVVIDGEQFNLNKLEDSNSGARSTHEIFLRSNDQLLYSETNNIDDTLNFKLSSSLSASFPLAVYATEIETFPKSSFSEFGYRYHKGAFDHFFNPRLLDDVSIRLSNVIHIWNVFRYAYVYNPLNEKDEINLLRNTLSEVMEANTIQEYYETVWKMLATYKDAHIFFHMGEVDAQHNYSLPLSVIQLDGKYYIRNIHADSLKSNVNLGDEILAIDNQDIKTIADQKSKFGSGSQHNINTRVIFSLLSGAKDSESVLKIKDHKTGDIKNLTLTRDYQNGGPMTMSALPNKNNRMLNGDTYYFNANESNITDTLLRFINDSTKNIVFDVRGYLTHDFEEHKILNKLLSDTVYHEIFYSYDILSPLKKKFRKGPQISIPENREKKAKFYFLADRTTQSAPETFLDIIKHWKIGKIVGQPTAGANGNINYLWLPGNMAVTFSGIKVLNSDGSEHHLIGVKPDYYVDFTLQDIINKSDPYIIKALELIAN